MRTSSEGNVYAGLRASAAARNRLKRLNVQLMNENANDSFRAPTERTFDTNTLFDSEIAGRNITRFQIEELEPSITIRRLKIRNCLLAVLLILLVIISAAGILGFIGADYNITPTSYRVTDYSRRDLVILPELEEKLLKSDLQKFRRNIHVLQAHLQRAHLQQQKLTKWLLMTPSEKSEEKQGRYDTNDIELTDFALESSGAYIKTTIHTTSYFKRKKTISILGFDVKSFPLGPNTILQDKHSPGDCFTFEGGSASIQIKLSAKVYVKAVTIDHLPYPGLSENATPKDFVINGLTQNGVFNLGQFQYDLHGSPVQTFTIQEVKSSTAFRDVELQILSNYGNVEFTCLYRFRVHGKRAFE